MKKNPLNDLDQFLQQEAHSIVPPASLSDKLKQENHPSALVPHVSPEEQLLTLAQQDPTAFYNLLISVGEKMEHKQSTMLINTALFLKNGDNWKEAVKEYWSK